MTRVYVDRNRMCRGEPAIVVDDDGTVTCHTELSVAGRVVQRTEPMVTGSGDRVHVWIELED